MSSPLEGLLIGRTLCDRYLIEEVIGRGGMSVVYRAADRRLGRPVALKVVSLPAGQEDRDELRARLRREAGSAARIPAHPNVVHVYDYGTDPDLDLDFIVMELLRGRDLKAAMARGGLGPGESLRILRESARGIAAGHRAGIVHRDVKPANIFLAGDGRVEMVKILDFGIAKALEIEPEDDLTRTGTLPHSPAYASPEQASGVTPLTPASDVYQLGLVAYELLAGARPYTTQERDRIGLGEEIPLPERGRWSELPADVREVITRALQRLPEDRYPNAAEFAEGVSRVAAPTFGQAGAMEPVSDDATVALESPRSSSAAGAWAGAMVGPEVGAGAISDETQLHEALPTGAAADLTQLHEQEARGAAEPPPGGAAPATSTEGPAPAEAPAARSRRAAAGFQMPGRAAQVAIGAALALLALFAITRMGGDEPLPEIAETEVDFSELDEEFRPLIQQAAVRGWEEEVEEESDAASEIESIILDMNDAWVRGDLSRHIAHYAERVDFYDSYGAPRSYIERERGRALERFPEREITIRGTAITFPEPGEARALIDKRWDFGGGDLDWTGSARQELTLELRNGVWLVTGERDVEVYDSDRS